MTSNQGRRTRLATVDGYPDRCELPTRRVIENVAVQRRHAKDVGRPLASDQRDRDNFVKMDTLQTRQFPKAEFVPTKTSGLTLPMPTSGEFTFKLTGQMTIHGKTKEVTFDVVARRSGNDLTATATAAPTWKFSDFGMSAPSVPFRVVSVVDEIRVVVDLVATAKA